MAVEDPHALLLANVGQKILCTKDGKILMCRGVPASYGKLSQLWDFPGGRMHKGEQPKEALVRELYEELGVGFEIGAPLSVSVTYQTPSNVPRYYVIFEATLTQPEKEFTVDPDELSEVRWVSPGEIATLPTWEDWRVLLTDYFKNHA